MEQVILKLYRNDKSIVNDDKRLLAQVWYEYGWNDDKTLYENLKRMPSSETITRARRKLHQDGLIQYSKYADNRRYELFKDHRYKYGRS